mgnify:CR=1 FL=1
MALNNHKGSQNMRKLAIAMIAAAGFAAAPVLAAQTDPAEDAEKAEPAAEPTAEPAEQPAPEPAEEPASEEPAPEAA